MVALECASCGYESTLEALVSGGRTTGRKLHSTVEKVNAAMQLRPRRLPFCSHKYETAIPGGKEEDRKQWLAGWQRILRCHGRINLSDDECLIKCASAEGMHGTSPFFWSHKVHNWLQGQSV